MNGQWIGTYSGSYEAELFEGKIHVNIDERHEYYQGVAYLFENAPKSPVSIAGFRTKNKEHHFNFQAENIATYDRRTMSIVGWDVVKELYPLGTIFPTSADVEGSWDDESLNLSWTTNLGTNGKSVLSRQRADQPSELKAKAISWQEYKDYVSAQETRGLLFRGQSDKWRLRTSFHRTGRADILRFLNDDIPVLYNQNPLVASEGWYRSQSPWSTRLR